MWLIQNKEMLVRLLLAALLHQAQQSSQVFTGTYIDARAQPTEFNLYKQTTKLMWVTERQDLAMLLGNVQTRLKTYGLGLFPAERASVGKFGDGVVGIVGG